MDQGQRCIDGRQPGLEGGDELYVSESELAPEDRTIRWRWAAGGALLMASLHAILVFGVLPASADQFPVMMILLGGLPYLVSGLLWGKLVQKLNLLEGFYAAVVPAAVFPFLVEFARVQALEVGHLGQVMMAMDWLAVVAAVLGYVGTALYGCWAGQRILGGPSPARGRVLDEHAPTPARLNVPTRQDTNRLAA